MGTSLTVISRSRDPLKTKVFGGVDYKYELLHVLVNASGTTLTPSSGVSFTVPANGAFFLQVSLSTPAIITLSINGTPTTINAGAALNANSLYEFEIHAVQGDTITIYTSTTATANVLRVFFRYNM